MTAMIVKDYIIEPGANLAGANLFEADLTGANLSGAVLYHADLTGANLSGAIMPDGSIHD